MTTLAHIASGSLIGLMVAQVSPAETDLVVASIISAGIIDIDHIILLMINKKFFKQYGYKNTLHKARSFMHELIGFLIIGLIMLIVSFFNLKFALVLGIPAMIHLTEDLVMGISIPYNPIDKTEVSLIKQKNTTKIIVDIITLISFGFLWIKYLIEAN